MSQLARAHRTLLQPDPQEGTKDRALTDEVRAGLVAEARATLETIREHQTRTRDRHGKIKRAKFKASVLTLRWEGFSPTETAQMLGVGIGQVRNALNELRKSATMDAELDRLDQIAVPLAVDNVIRGVMDGDKDYTRDVLNGRGIYRSHKSIEAQVRKTTLSMSIAVTMPDGATPGAMLPMVRPGGVLAAPSLPVVEGAVVKREDVHGQTERENRADPARAGE